MINFDNLIKENINENNSNWPKISNHPYTVLLIDGSASRKTN